MRARRRTDIIEALSKAAVSGSLSAAFILGRLYDEGWGVKKSARTAFRWCSRAAKGGLSEAFYFVGSAYAFGMGVPTDESKAFEWFQRSAKAGDLTGSYMTAISIFEGTGVKGDPKFGMKLLLAAAARGSHDAMDYLAAHYQRLGKSKEARRWA